MGAFLDKPKTEKFTSSGQGPGLTYAVTSMQGWRVDMEDAHSVQIGLDSDVLQEWSYFAVFDGHAGARVAQYCAQHLLHTILKTEEMGKVVTELKANGGKLNDKLSELVRKGMRAGFLALDEGMREEPEVYGENERSGTTAVAALLSPTHLYVANLGDSRAVLSRAEALAFHSEDHKPFLPKERDRIVNAGGSVMIQRVNGSLAVSRALGDYEYKSVPGLHPTQQLVSPEPDVYVMDRDTTGDEFVVLACDGVYDVMTNTELCDFVRSRLRITQDLEAIGNQILDTCLSKGSRDNMSCVLVRLPGCPAINEVAQKADKELHDQLETRIRGIVSLSDSPAEIETEYIMRILMNQDIPGVPPGAGLHAVRNTVTSLLAQVQESAGVPVSAQVLAESKQSVVKATAASTANTPPPAGESVEQLPV